MMRSAGIVASPAVGAAATDRGLERQRNEDSLLVADLDRGRLVVGEGWSGPVSGGPRGTLVAVCDGCGGEAAGDVASRLVAADMAERAQNFPAPTGPMDVQHVTQLLLTALDRTNNHVLLEQKRDEKALRGMGSTFTGFLLHRDAAICCHVGDSRAYLLRGGELIRMTRDHTKAADLVEAGQLDAAAAERDPRRNELTRSMGRANIQPAVFWGRFAAGDRLLLCSDGLSGYVDEIVIARYLAQLLDPEEAAEALVKAALAVGAPDNVSLVVVSFGERWAPRAGRDTPPWPRLAVCPIPADLQPAAVVSPPADPPPSPPEEPPEAAVVPEYVPWEATGVRALPEEPAPPAAPPAAPPEKPARKPPPPPRRSRSSEILAAIAGLLGSMGVCAALAVNLMPDAPDGPYVAVGAAAITLGAILYLLFRGAPRGGE